MIYLLPFISAFIGWITNKIAIKMLFHPQKPIRFLGLTIQGIFPKRQQQFAASLGTLVANELIHMDEITAKIKSPETSQMVLPMIEQHVDQFIKTKLQEEIPLLSMFIGSDTIVRIKKSIVNEFDQLLPILLEHMSKGLQEKIDIEKMVTDKVAAFSIQKLESILMQIMKKEFTFVEVIGAIIGFLIGIFQLLISQLT
ncbi:MAG: DUF445 family protein [Chitinophagaceae bacterium]